MKITLEFNEDETEQARDAMQAGSYRACIDDYLNYLRSRLKHEDLEDNVYAALTAAREKMYELIQGLD